MKFNGQTEEKWGLCFAGGGGKGAYEIGVWRALEECTNIKFSAVAGTSVGALNAILFATKAVDEAEEIWRGITPDKLLKPKKETFIELLDNTLDVILNESGRNFMEYGILEELIRNNPKNDQFVKYVLEEGIFSRKGLEEIIKTSGVAHKIQASKIECFAAVSNVQKKKTDIEYNLLNKMSEKEVIDTLLASSALPVVYGKQKVNGEKYRDGGLLDNVPYKALEKCGCSHAVVVHLKNSNQKNKVSDLAVTGISPLLWKSISEDNLSVNRYEDMVIINIYPQRNLKGLLGTLNFNPRSIDKLIRYGYEDTKEVFK